MLQGLDCNSNTVGPLDKATKRCTDIILKVTSSKHLGTQLRDFQLGSSWIFELKLPPYLNTNVSLFELSGPMPLSAYHPMTAFWVFHTHGTSARKTPATYRWKEWKRFKYTVRWSCTFNKMNVRFVQHRCWRVRIAPVAESPAGNTSVCSHKHDNFPTLATSHLVCSVGIDPIDH